MRSSSPARVIVAILLLSATALTACGKDEGTRASGETVQLTAQDSGSTVPLTTGDQVVITLDSNITTGFAWKLTKEPDAGILDLTSSHYVEPTTSLIGAGGSEVWRFVATGPGTTSLEMKYERSSGESVGDVFALQADVSR
jgi:inhibitor of cysteine peptidase